MRRIEILKNSLAKKQEELQGRINSASEHHALTNGQPMNDKRNGRSWFNQAEKKENAIFNQFDSIKKTEAAIEREEARLEWLQGQAEGVREVIASLPVEVQDMIQEGTLKPWWKHPHFFFVDGVDKGRIKIFKKLKGRGKARCEMWVIEPWYFYEIPHEQRNTFREVWKKLNTYFGVEES